MPTIRWSAEAAADLQAIHDFIARDTARYARAICAVCAELVEATEQLLQFPRSGRDVPELQRADFPEVLRGSYRVVYRLRGADTIEIVTIFHAARVLRLERAP